MANTGANLLNFCLYVQRIFFVNYDTFEIFLADWEKPLSDQKHNFGENYIFCKINEKPFQGIASDILLFD